MSKEESFGAFANADPAIDPGSEGPSMSGNIFHRKFIFVLIHHRLKKAAIMTKTAHCPSLDEAHPHHHLSKSFFQHRATIVTLGYISF